MPSREWYAELLSTSRVPEPRDEHGLPGGVAAAEAAMAEATKAAEAAAGKRKSVKKKA